MSASFAQFQAIGALVGDEGNMEKVVSLEKKVAEAEANFFEAL